MNARANNERAKAGPGSSYRMNEDYGFYPDAAMGGQRRGYVHYDHSLCIYTSDPHGAVLDPALCQASRA